MQKKFWIAASIFSFFLIALLPSKALASPTETRQINSTLQLFVDEWLIERKTNLELVLQHPTPKEVAIQFDKEWEGIDAAYVTVMKDGDRYRMYYRGNPINHPEVVCYAESTDLVHWTKPKLNLFSFNGSTANNIVWIGDGTHNFSPMKDPNPAAPSNERYKAVGGEPKLYGFTSPDGLHWNFIQKDPIMSNSEFDSQNIAFWDPNKKQYVSYYRGWRDHIRDIKTSVSSDFIHWSAGDFLDYGNTKLEDLYTNAITPYFRAPHIYVGFPKRFVPGRTVVTEQPLNGVSDGLFMSSRDGLHWNRSFREAFIRPGPERLNWMHRSNMTAWGLEQSSPTEMSLFYSEFYNTTKNQLRRATLRLDGFVAVHATPNGGEWVSRPLTFTGSKLQINYSTSAAGSIKVEVQDESGRPLPGFSLANSTEIYGDEIARTVAWSKGTSVKSLEGQTVRLRFVMKDSDLYSLRFE